ncbi:MAG: protein-export chaperone SecB [Candidatus Thiodiazotropha sp.]
MTETKKDAPKREFVLQRVYTKDVSFETPKAPGIFQKEWKPETKINLNTEVNKLDDDVYEVCLTVTVTTQLGEETAYLVEAKQAGIFTITGFNEQEMGNMLGVYCPNQLFPYLREVLSDLITKGSFPQLVLQPINFEALYAQHQQQVAEQASSASEAKH